MIGVIKVPWGEVSSLNGLGKVRFKFKTISNPKEMEDCNNYSSWCRKFLLIGEFLDSGWRNHLKVKRTFLGICLGMHALFEGSEESKGEGLDY